MLRIRDLSVSFERYRGLLARERIVVLDGVDLDVAAGEVVAVVGASGSGKSLLAHSLLGILPANALWSGTLSFEGETLDRTRIRALAGKAIALVPQSLTFLDPTARAGRQLARAARRTDAPRGSGRHATMGELARYALTPEVARLFPHQLSGGMARRVLTALATIGGARLLVADEPTNGLDPAVTATALDALRARADAGAGVIVITHDIPAVARAADRIVVLHAGRSVETARMAAFVDGEPCHPYAATLKAALPGHGFAPARISPPPALRVGCLHAHDCARASGTCRTRAPSWSETPHGWVRCHHALGA